MTMTIDADLASVVRFYEERLGMHGTTAPGVGWRDETSHRLRFAKLATAIEDGEGGRIADLGCGYGAFHDYLRNLGVRIERFVGYDISRRMLAEARRRVPAGEFVYGDAIDREVDFAFACGTFHARMQVEETDWRRLILRALDSMDECAVRGFAFNMLTTYVDYKDPENYYGDPCDFFDHCKRQYGRKVALLHDYPLHEWTIVVRK